MVLMALCCIIGFARLKKSDKAPWLILAIVLTMLLGDILMITITPPRQPNLYIYNLTYIPKFCFFFGYFILTTTQDWVKKTSYVMIPILVLFSLWNYFFFQGRDTFNTYSYIPEAFVTGVFSYLGLRKLIVDDDLSRHNFHLLVLIANCLYFFVAIPVETLEPYIVELSIPVALLLYKIQNISEAIWLIIISLAFLWKKPART